MKRILVNATHAEEIRVALCKGNHLYDFDLENRTREQKKANIYKGHVTRVEPSLEAVFVEYGSERQGFLSMREIAREYLKGDPRSTNNIRELISEGTELLVQVEKEERGNKGAALSTYISLAGRYLVLMPNNASGGGISRQISGNVRDEMKRMLSKLQLPNSMSVIIRTAGIGRTQDDLQNDLNHLLSIWNNINSVAKSTPSPCLTHQEAGVVTRAVRDYLREDVAEVWIDNEQAFNEAHHFVQAVMPHQVQKLRKYLDIEPMFSRFGVENQIETAYQREVKLPSGGSIVIDQTEALVSIDINSAKATKGADVESTAYNTNLEAADEIARQLRLRDMGGLIVIDFIDMGDDKHQRNVEQRLRDATQLDRARIQFAQISRFGLLEMSRQRLRPSLEEATGYKCPRCHGTGMVRDLGSLSLSIMRNIEEIALREGRGEVQAEVPIEVGAFLLNEKRDSLVYLEQDSGARITILPHAHLETPHYKIHYNRNGYEPSSYDRINNTHAQETKSLGYDTNWQTDRPAPSKQKAEKQKQKQHKNNKNQARHSKPAKPNNASSTTAWLSNLFTPAKQATTSDNINTQDVATAIEDMVNAGAVSKGVDGQLNSAATATQAPATNTSQQTNKRYDDKNKRRKPREDKRRRKNKPHESQSKDTSQDTNQKPAAELPKREANSRRSSRGTRDRNRDVSQHSQKNVPAQSSAPVQAPNPNEVKVDIVKSDATAKHNAEVVNIDLDNNTVTKTPLAQTKQAAAKTQAGKPKTTDVADVKQPSRDRSQHATQTADNSANKQPTKATQADAATATQTQSNSVSTGEAPTIEAADKPRAKAAVWTGRAKNDPRDHHADRLKPQALTEDTVAAHAQAILATNTSQLASGTAQVESPRPAYRASNDPRGRIDGFDTVPAQFMTSSSTQGATEESLTASEAVTTADSADTHTPEAETESLTVTESEVTADNVESVESDIEIENDVKDNAAATAPSEVPQTSLKQHSVGSFIKSVLGNQADTLLSENKVSEAFIMAMSHNAPDGQSQAEATSESSSEASTENENNNPNVSDETNASLEDKQKAKPKRRGRPPKKKPSTENDPQENN